MTNSPQSTRRVGVIYIAGVGHSGSTLLDVMLGHHPRIEGLGEAHRLSIDPDSRRSADGLPINKSPFWRPVLEAVAERRRVDWNRWPSHLPTSFPKGNSLRRHLLDLQLLACRAESNLVARLPPLRNYMVVISNSLQIYDEIARDTGVEWIVDSTKNPGRMKGLWMRRPDLVAVVHLVRDPRAIVASAKRREDTPVRKSARRWVVGNARVELTLRTMPRVKKLLVRYEDVCRQPQTQLRRIYNLLGLEEVDIPLGALTSSHQIPGNQWILERGRSGIEVTIDERWRDQMCDKELELVEKDTATYFRRYGYSPLSEG